MMKKHRIYIYAIGLMALMVACTNNNENTEPSDRYFTLKVDMPGKNGSTRVGVIQPEDELNLHAFWESGDKMDFFAVVKARNEKVSFGSFEAKDISNDGRSCVFNIQYPEGFDRSSPFQLIGVYGKYASIFEGKITANASLVRTTLPAFKAPLWLSVGIDGYSKTDTCKHFGTYEVLHITNKGDNDITFRLNGYRTYRKWYYNEASFMPETQTYEPGRFGWSTNDEVAPIVRIKSGETAPLISWYIPSGEKFDDVTMEAEIDGQEILSANTKSSSISFSNGCAYHLYVTWDGKKLWFGEPEEFVNELGFEPTELELVEDGGYTYEMTGREDFYVFESSNPKVATAAINDEFRDWGSVNVQISSHEIGEAIVTITDTGTDKKSQLKVTVSERFEYYAITEVGTSYEVAIKNKNGIYEAYIDDPSIATFTINGNIITVTGVKLGNTVIHVTEKTSGKQYTIEVYVNEDGGHVGPDNPPVEDGELDDVSGYEL